MIDTATKYKETYYIDNENEYRFESVIKYTPVQMCARFELSSEKDIYQFEFGVYNTDSSPIDTKLSLGNSDAYKTLSTIAVILCNFLDQHPEAIVRFSGSNESRTMLFRIWITKNLESFSDNYVIYGNNELDKWERYTKNRKYSAIIVRKRL